MPRRHRTEPKNSPRRILALERQRKALDLSLNGANYVQIAQALGFANRSGAYLAVQAAMKRIVQPGVEELRDRNLERLNRMRLGLQGAQFKGEGEAIAIELRLQEREARYLGLDKQPTEDLAKAAALAQAQVNVLIQVGDKQMSLGEWRRQALISGPSDNGSDDGQAPV